MLGGFCPASHDDLDLIVALFKKKASQRFYSRLLFQGRSVDGRFALVTLRREMQT